MSVFSVNPRDGNPVTTSVLDEVTESLGVTIKEEEKEDYRRLLAVFHESAEELMAMPDFELQTDLDRFPRRNVHFLKREENLHGAWAWKCSIQDQKENYGILKGKRVVLKDNIALKDVPMLLGTDFIKDYVPVSIPGAYVDWTDLARESMPLLQREYSKLEVISLAKVFAKTCAIARHRTQQQPALSRIHTPRAIHLEAAQVIKPRVRSMGRTFFYNLILKSTILAEHYQGGVSLML